MNFRDIIDGNLLNKAILSSKSILDKNVFSAFNQTLVSIKKFNTNEFFNDQQLNNMLYEGSLTVKLSEFSKLPIKLSVLSSGYTINGYQRWVLLFGSIDGLKYIPFVLALTFTVNNSILNDELNMLGENPLGSWLFKQNVIHDDFFIQIVEGKLIRSRKHIVNGNELNILEYFIENI